VCVCVLCIIYSIVFVCLKQHAIVSGIIITTDMNIIFFQNKTPIVFWKKSQLAYTDWKQPGKFSYT
jgi:hypothetical protein